MITTNEVTVEISCVDCGQVRHVARGMIMHTRGVCGFCYVQRAIEDYQAWCGAMDVDYDEESADEYLFVTNYGSSLPEWIQARVKDYAAKAAA